MHLTQTMNEPEILSEMLDLRGSSTRSVAVIGLSDNPAKPSHYVSAYLQEAGFRILPVNPALEQVLGERCFASLRDLPVVPDVVNVFRLPRHIPEIVEEMIALGFHNLWVQSGIRHPEAALRAEAAGIHVVMDRCIMVEHKRLAAQRRDRP